MLTHLRFIMFLSSTPLPAPCPPGSSHRCCKDRPTCGPHQQVNPASATTMEPVMRLDASDARNSYRRVGNAVSVRLAFDGVIL